MQQKSDERPWGSCPVCFGRSLDVYVDRPAPIITPNAFGPSRTEFSPGTILRCETCRFGFRERRPSDEQLAQLYKDLETRTYDSETAGRFKSALRQLKMVQRHAAKPGRLLDIGCGSGLFLKCAIDAGWEAEGIDPSSGHCASARSIPGLNSRIHETTLKYARLPAASFDVVTMWDVLEHVPDPICFLKDAGSFLKSGGVLFAKVPNLDSIQARVLGWKWPMLLPEHLNYFNSGSLRMCGSKADLQWVGSFRPVSVFSLGYVFWRFQQHDLPFASFAFGWLRSRAIRSFLVPVPLGEICGVWRSS
jgi:SAM-dependent methyltransferase